MDTLHTKPCKLAAELGFNTIKSQGCETSYETKEAFVEKKFYL